MGEKPRHQQASHSSACQDTEFRLNAVLRRNEDASVSIGHVVGSAGTGDDTDRLGTRVVREAAGNIDSIGAAKENLRIGPSAIVSVEA